MKVLETDRLILRRLSPEDAEFILQLLNEPSWLRFIGDKGVRTIEDARNYILRGPVEMYSRLGFGLYLVELKEGGVSIGICGLIKRASLDDVDIGFAFLPKFWRKGYAYESASAVMAYGRSAFGLTRLAAITSADNDVSAALLKKLGFNFERMMKLSDDGDEVRLFTVEVMAVPTHQQILELERRLRDAMRGSDLDELDALLADGLVFTDHLGALWGKQDDLTAHRVGAIRVRSVEASEERIQVHDGVAVVNVRLTISGIFSGQEASGDFRFTRVWVPGRDGRWQVVAAQATLVERQGGGAGLDGTT